MKNKVIKGLVILMITSICLSGCGNKKQDVQEVAQNTPTESYNVVDDDYPQGITQEEIDKSVNEYVPPKTPEEYLKEAEEHAKELDKKRGYVGSSGTGGDEEIYSGDNTGLINSKENGIKLYSEDEIRQYLEEQVMDVPESPTDNLYLLCSVALAYDKKIPYCPNAYDYNIGYPKAEESSEGIDYSNGNGMGQKGYVTWLIRNALGFTPMELRVGHDITKEAQKVSIDELQMGDICYGTKGGFDEMGIVIGKYNGDAIVSLSNPYISYKRMFGVNHITLIKSQNKLGIEGFPAADFKEFYRINYNQKIPEPTREKPEYVDEPRDLTDEVFGTDINSNPYTSPKSLMSLNLEKMIDNTSYKLDTIADYYFKSNYSGLMKLSKLDIIEKDKVDYYNENNIKNVYNKFYGNAKNVVRMCPYYYYYYDYDEYTEYYVKLLVQDNQEPNSEMSVAVYNANDMGLTIYDDGTYVPYNHMDSPYNWGFSTHA